MRAKAIGPLLGAVAVAALLLPVAAEAKPADHGPSPRGFHLNPAVSESFSLQGTRGFVVTVKMDDRRTLEVSAAKLALGLGIGATGATYTVPYRQPSGSDEIDAQIGNLGRIDVHFVRESVKKEPPFLSSCNGGKTLIEEGEFVGSIDFRGEDGFTRIRGHHAAGTITRRPAITCRFDTKGEEDERQTEKKEAESESQTSESESEGVELKATTTRGPVDFKGVRVRLRAKPGKGFGLINFDATASRNLGRISETSEAGTVFDAGKSFLSPEPRWPTREAVIHPGSPFKGSATFRRSPEGSVTWTGDLRVELPGFGVVLLAGHGTHAAMCEPLDCLGR